MTFTTNEGQVVEAEFNDGRTADPAGYDVGAKVTVAYLPDDPSDILPMPERELYVYEPSSGPQIEYVLPIFFGLAMVALVTHQLLRKEDES